VNLSLERRDHDVYKEPKPVLDTGPESPQDSMVWLNKWRPGPSKPRRHGRSRLTTSDSALVSAL
jgi:hypothetical protein